jgi:hypothetical protein
MAGKLGPLLVGEAAGQGIVLRGEVGATPPLNHSVTGTLQGLDRGQPGKHRL